MGDFYFVYSVIDIIWKIFSILFVLYRFTSFFSMLYEFFKFLGKLLKGLIYVKDQIVIYIRKRNNYSIEEYDLPIRQESFFTKLYNKIFKRNNNHIYLPLYETRTERVNNYHSENDNDSENETFNKLLHSNISMQESSEIFNSSYYDINTKINTSSNMSVYSLQPPQQPQQQQPQPQPQQPQPFNVQESFNLLKSDFINNILKINKRNDEQDYILEESDELDSLFKPNF
jgi:hypothetical protein